MNQNSWANAAQPATVRMYTQRQLDAAVAAQRELCVAAIEALAEGWGEEKCATPKVGETWHILRAGATACDTVKIADISQRTVLFEPKIYGVDGERLPLWQGLQFVERASGA